MTPPCGHAAPLPAGCRWCRMACERDTRYAALWWGLDLPAAGAGQAAPRRCRHLGGPTGDVVQCPSCRGSVGLKLFACAAHGLCTPGKAAPGIACCAGCPDRQPSPDPDAGRPHAEAG